MRILCISLCMVMAAPAAARPRMFFEVFGGSAFNLRAPLTVSQNGRSDIRFTARYDTKSFQSPLYYAMRFGARNGDSAWELELIHHKLYLANPPREIAQFEISHGCNLLVIMRSRRLARLDVRIGAGPALIHGESIVRDRANANSGFLSTGYEWTGPALVVGVGKRFRVTPRIFVTSDLQFTAARIHVPVYDGEASAPNYAVHALIGVGFSSR